MLRIRLRLSLKFTLAVLGAMTAAWTSRSIAAGSLQEGATSGSPPAESSEAAAESALAPEDSAKTPAAAEEGAADRSYRHAAIITIRDEITDVTTGSLKRRIEAARKAGADLVVFELDTPGGYLDSALDIAHLIENTRDLRTAAWVNPQAHSAGTIIAVACNEIVMAPSSTMGDSQVIMFGAEGADAVPEALQPKVYTPVLARFRSSAKLNGYSEVLCEAFVIPEREVWWLENARTGEREFVFREEKQKRLGEREAGSDGNAVQKVTRAILGMGEDGAAASGEWRLVESYVDLVTGKAIALTQPIDREDQLLEMNAGEAHAFGFNRAIIAQDADLQARYGAATITRMDTLWSENLATWLTSPYVRGFLLILVFLGAYVEFNTPGVGVPGLVALIALAIFVGAPYLTGLANTWELVLIGVGIVLLAVEVFVLPGFGVAGVSGALLLLAGLVATFMPDEPGRTSPLYVPQLQPTIDALYTGVKAVVFALTTSLVGMFVLAKYMPHIPIFRKVIPANPTADAVAVEDAYYGLAQPGDMGVSQGPLRPAGKARFGAVLVDVVTQGEYIESGVGVKVVERQGNRVVVREVR
ncbi:MAG: hypothetical protein KJ057_10480 [Phycisphaerae bacterium]|nr:MAG: hypothetical protein EDS66_13480 [Planctomycetota bacterium]KAB2949731.1 MAG: hypothetical protein F9K17_02005 [Phycisphaerae bacterium]MBE7457509.1 hypothetical protein [Planctomycetia bacterium]MCK6464548.1 hypothetical protein [Phycisphaerae bacterium]MCL4718885.1 hypothetical protein [Phycisphaerae bacterium]